jgi:hypothetical protein
MNQKEYGRQYYLKNKERQDEYVKKYFQKNREWFISYKKNLKCEICGELHPAVLDFHHKNPKTKSFSIGLGVYTHSIKRVMLEIKKCIVLCSHCHKKLHWEWRMLDEAFRSVDPAPPDEVDPAPPDEST